MESGTHRIFVTADTHFGHKNVIAYNNRPFSTIEEHDEILIKNWNERVGPTDIVFHLGDFALGPKTEVGHYLAQLNGQIYLYKGNHDRPKSFWKQFSDKVTMLPYAHQMGINMMGYKGVIFSHRPLDLRDIPPNFINLHGHIHSTPENPKFNTFPHVDCGVDYWDYAPVQLKNIIAYVVYHHLELQDKEEK